MGALVLYVLFLLCLLVYIISKVCSIKSLASKFVSLGNMTGKTYLDIMKVVGPETSRSISFNEFGEIVIIRQWFELGYHIVIMFDSYDNFICICNETCL